MQLDNMNALLSAHPYMQNAHGEKPVEKIYQIFSGKGDCERVLAITASEAIKKSTIKNPVRVLQYNPMNQVLIKGEEFIFNNAAVDEAVAAQAAESSEQPATPDAAAVDSGEAAAS